MRCPRASTIHGHLHIATSSYSHLPPPLHSTSHYHRKTPTFTLRFCSFCFCPVGSPVPCGSAGLFLRFCRPLPLLLLAWAGGGAGPSRRSVLAGRWGLSLPSPHSAFRNHWLPGVIIHIVRRRGGLHVSVVDSTPAPLSQGTAVSPQAGPGLFLSFVH